MRDEAGTVEATAKVLVIEDDGQGFDVERMADGGMGLNTMRERAAAIGATLEVESTPGEMPPTARRMSLKRL